MTRGGVVALALLALGLALPPGARAAASADPESAALLERAQFWQARNRDDLAREALDRLFRVSPDDPEGLAMLARLQLRANQDAEAARTYERLRAAHPGHPAVAQLAAAFRVRGADKGRLRQARQLVQVGRIEEAAKAYRALFPDAFPDDDLALEYAQVLGATKDGWEEAHRLIAELAKRHADDPKYRLALASHLSMRDPGSPDTLRTFRELSAVPAVSKPAREAWRRAVLRLDAVEESVPALREYVAADPGDSAVREKLDGVLRAVEQQRKLLADPAYRAKRDGLALLEAGRLEEAQARLQEALAGRPKDAEIIGAMGLLRMRQGRHAEAADEFLRARDLDAANRAKWDGLARTARYWDSLKQAGRARDSGQLEVAERHAQEARRLDPKEPNAAIELARIRAAQGRAADAERLYREALALAPGNGNAIEGLVALLYRAGRDPEAEAIIDALTPAQRREIGDAIDVLRAARLRDKAKTLQAQGRSAQAIAVLEEAAAIDRRDPWLRLDLARLYASRGETARGRALFDALLQQRPEDADSLFAAALFLSSVGREAEALANLERVREADRTAGMARLQRRLWVSVQGERALAFAKNGRPAQAAQVLSSAQQAIGGDADLALDVAGAYVQTGDFRAARNLLDRFAAPPAQPSLDWRVGQARLLNRMGADAELRALLVGMAALGPMTPEQEEAIGDLNLSLALRRADALARRKQAGAGVAASCRSRNRRGRRPRRRRDWDMRRRARFAHCAAGARRRRSIATSFARTRRKRMRNWRCSIR